MANPLVISEDMKYGKEEILLDPTKSPQTRCGAEVTALTANDLFVTQEGENPIDLIAYIDTRVLALAGNGGGSDANLPTEPIVIQQTN